MQAKFLGQLRVCILLVLACLAAPLAAPAQQSRMYRIGVVLSGGPYYAALDGLRDGLKDLGLEEDKQFVFHVRDLKGDVKSAGSVARGLEKEKVDVIYSVATSVTLEVKLGTERVPIVFYAGFDPVAARLVESIPRPGGRLSGIFSRSTLLAAKRLELLKEMVPKQRRVLIFYNPENPISQQQMKMVKDAARELKVQLVQRRVGSADQLRAGMEALRPGEVDGLVYTDTLVVSQSDMIIEIGRTKKLPIVVGERASVVKGALASYGVSYYTNGRLAAKHVQRVLQGTSPGEIPVEQVDRLHLVINLKTAKALGLTIPRSVLARADEIIE